MQLFGLVEQAANTPVSLDRLAAVFQVVWQASQDAEVGMWLAIIAFPLPPDT
jgi:hypothetical protein